MATSYKILGQLNPPANTQTTVYTTPAANSTVISTITICNQSNTAATFCIALQKAGASLSSQQYVNFNTPIPGNDTINLTLGITMAATDVLSANANTSSVSFNVFGSEIY